MPDANTDSYSVTLSPFQEKVTGCPLDAMLETQGYADCEWQESADWLSFESTETDEGALVINARHRLAGAVSITGADGGLRLTIQRGWGNKAIDTVLESVGSVVVGLKRHLDWQACVERGEVPKSATRSKRRRRKAG